MHVSKKSRRDGAAARFTIMSLEQWRTDRITRRPNKVADVMTYNAYKARKLVEAKALGIKL